jgi:DNA-binding IclR family transcriptional regulator
MEEEIERRIVEVLGKHPEGLTITQLAEELGINRIKASKFVYGLRKAGILRQRPVGRAILCYLVKKP